jgi:hypothetical protein
MAISTGDISSDAMADLQTEVEGTNHVHLTLANLCFIFKKKYELDGVDIRGDFQDMVDWLDAQSWVANSGMFLHVSWRDQSVYFTTAPVIEPSTRENP